jgi:hypothetical protein
MRCLSMLLMGPVCRLEIAATARGSRRLYPPRASFSRSRISSISQSSISASSTAASIKKGASPNETRKTVRWAVTRRPSVASPGAIESVGGEAPRRYNSRASGAALRLLPTRASKGDSTDSADRNKAASRGAAASRPVAQVRSGDPVDRVPGHFRRLQSNWYVDVRRLRHDVAYRPFVT